MNLLNNTTTKIMLPLFIFVFTAMQSFAQMHLIRSIQHEPDSKWLEPPASLQSRIGDFDLTSDSRYLATSGTSDDIRIWDTATGELVRSINNPGSGNIPIRFLPDQKRIAAGGSDGLSGIVKVIDIQTGAVEWVFEHSVKELHSPYVREIAISPNSKKLIMLAGSSMTLWSLETGEQLARHETAPGHNYKYLSDNIRLFIDGTNRALIFNGDTGEIERSIDGLFPRLLYDEKHVVIQEGDGTNQGRPDATFITRFKTIDIENGSVISTSADFDFIASSRNRVSPSGETMVHFNSESEAKETNLFQMATATKARTFQTPDIDYFSWYKFSPNGRMLASVKDDIVYLWDISDLDTRIQNPNILNN